MNEQQKIMSKREPAYLIEQIKHREELIKCLVEKLECYETEFKCLKNELINSKTNKDMLYIILENAIAYKRKSDFNEFIKYLLDFTLCKLDKEA